MSTLLELQSRFRDAVIDNSLLGLASHTRNNGIPVETGIEIYQNNIFTNLREALRTIFPVINKLVGEEFFNYASNDFIHEYPSPAGDLNQYGEYFAEFLAQYPAVAELVYLPDVANLEWVIHQVYHATDAAALDTRRLAAIPSETYGQLTFILNPACALFYSKYPVHRIWQQNQEGSNSDDTIDLDAGGVNLLITRQHDLIELDVLDFAEWTFLHGFSTSKNFARACRNAIEVNPQFDLQHCMRRYVAESVIVDFKT